MNFLRLSMFTILTCILFTSTSHAMLSQLSGRAGGTLRTVWRSTPAAASASAPAVAPASIWGGMKRQRRFSDTIFMEHDAMEKWQKAFDKGDAFKIGRNGTDIRLGSGAPKTKGKRAATTEAPAVKPRRGAPHQQTRGTHSQAQGKAKAVKPTRAYPYPRTSLEEALHRLYKKQERDATIAVAAAKTPKGGK